MYGSKALFWTLALWGSAACWACGGKFREDNAPQQAAGDASVGAQDASAAGAGSGAQTQGGSAGLAGALGGAGSLGNAGAFSDARAAGNAGAAGDAGAPPIEDYARARWPMPNAVGSGLPHPASYVITSASVVTDVVTGLHWQRTVAPSDLAFAQAVAYCDALSLDGHTDWRLPSRIELASLIAAGQGWSAQSSPFASLHNPHWSSSPLAFVGQSPSAAWSVDPVYPIMSADDLTQDSAVRCVRSEPNTRRAAYVVSAQTVTDTGTGLLWQRDVRGATTTLDSAEQQCAALMLDGQTGFRVPSLQELMSIADETRTNPALDPAVFTDEVSLAPDWAASPGLDFSFAGDGTITYDGALVQEFTGVRCVR